MIELVDVSKNLRKNVVLSQVSCRFERGKIYLLTGHNGSGKTMLLRVLCGLLTPNSGEVKRERSFSFGVIIERPVFMENETAFFNLKFLAGIKNTIGSGQIMEVLRKVNLFDQAKVKVKKYSLGMKQRLAVAQAIMEEPDILLLDEPFNALDEENYYRIIELLQEEIEKKDKLIVIATHGFVDKWGLIDEEIRLSNGKLTEIIHHRGLANTNQDLLPIRG